MGKRRRQRLGKPSRKHNRKARQATRQAHRATKRNKHNNKKLNKAVDKALHRQTKAIKKDHRKATRIAKRKEFFGKVNKGVSAVFKEVKEDVINPVKGVVGAITNIGNAAAHFGDQAANALPDVVEDLGDIGKGLTDDLGKGIGVLDNLSKPGVMIPLIVVGGGVAYMAIKKMG
jgi:hypothetical protein